MLEIVIVLLILAIIGVAVGLIPMDEQIRRVIAALVVTVGVLYVVLVLLDAIGIMPNPLRLR